MVSFPLAEHPFLILIFFLNRKWLPLQVEVIWRQPEGRGVFNLYYAAYISVRIKHIWPSMALVFRLLLEGYRNLRRSNYNETIRFIYI